RNTRVTLNRIQWVTFAGLHGSVWQEFPNSGSNKFLYHFDGRPLNQWIFKFLKPKTIFAIQI
ncbi:hypothetical protein, partial [Galbibacter orientalis]|uniref:hypothetical protein n=1 Tax=Galbibacter orientalis TaxID=453852 RepID=UPI0030801230